MHSAVLQNRKYIKHAAKNTVEVLVLSQIEKGIESGDRKAARFERKGPDGKPKRYFVKFPSLTLEDLQNLNRSKASTYNHSGKIPYTSVVDPFTEREVASFLGGISAKTLIEKTKAVRKKLIAAHGKPPLERKDLRRFEAALASIDGLLARREAGKALKELRQLAKKTARWPGELKAQLEERRERAAAVGLELVGEAEEAAAQDPKRAAAKLQLLARQLAGTEAGERAEAALARLRGSAKGG